MPPKPTSTPPDLTPYTHCPADEHIGLDPLAVGFLNGRPDYPQGKLPARFAETLLRFCQPEWLVCEGEKPRPCVLCRTPIPPYGTAEIRIIGDEDIFAAPDLIHHYVTQHGYQPPDEFIQAVLHGPQPHTAEYRALIRALR